MSDWRSLTVMSQDEMAVEICKLRSENTNLRNFLERYRRALRACRGASAALAEAVRLPE